MSSTNEVPGPSEIVDAMISAIERHDLDAALALMTDDVEYDNVPMSKRHGVEAVREGLAPFLARATTVEWKVFHQAATGDVVMNERLDRFEMPGGWIEIPVAGLFVIRDGKIALWRDYFDLATVTAAMAAIG